MLYINLFLFGFLFLMSCRVEYRYGVMLYSLGGTKPLSKGDIIDNILSAGLKSFGVWLLFASVYAILLGWLWMITELGSDFYTKHPITIDCIISLFMIWLIWKLYLKRLAQRMAEYDPFYEISNARSMLICCVLLCMVPYIVLSNFCDPALQSTDTTISPTQYSRDDTVFAQILQEVADTDGHVLSAEASIQEDIRNLYRDLRNMFIAGISISTILLGLIVVYFGCNQCSRRNPLVKKNEENIQSDSDLR